MVSRHACESSLWCSSLLSPCLQVCEVLRVYSSSQLYLVDGRQEMGVSEFSDPCFSFAVGIFLNIANATVVFKNSELAKEGSTNDSDVLRQFTLTTHPYVFTKLVSYHCLFGFLILFVSTMEMYMTTFQDLFLIVISIELAERYRQFKDRLKKYISQVGMLSYTYLPQQ